MLKADFPAAAQTAIGNFDPVALANAIDAAAIPGLNGNMFRDPTQGIIALCRVIMQVTDAPSNVKLRAVITLAASGQQLPFGIA